MQNGVTSEHTRRAYAKGLTQFSAFWRGQQAGPFSKALVGEYRAKLVTQNLAPATVNLRLSPIRKLAWEMADNGLLEPATAAAIERAKGVEQRGARVGNWLLKEQASDLLNAPSPRPSGANAIAPS